MAFVQIVEFRTSRIDEVRELEQEWASGAGDRVTARRTAFCQDRDDPGRYVVLAFFDSYEAAMANSELPETQRFAERLAGLVDGSPTFVNLDVVDELTFS
jgi:quinol monooxygenase YgiN